MLTITILTACLPWVLKALANKSYVSKPKGSASWLPLLAAMLFAVSYVLPTINISGTETFQQHFVGGGIYSACLFIYFRHTLGWKLPKYTAILFLFAWVSALGVANELFEFTLHQLHLVEIDISDTSWDLVANTLGAFAGYLLLHPLLGSGSSVNDRHQR